MALAFSLEFVGGELVPACAHVSAPSRPPPSPGETGSPVPEQIEAHLLAGSGWRTAEVLDTRE